jgi:hypothetical protein
MQTHDARGALEVYARRSNVSADSVGVSLSEA